MITVTGTKTNGVYKMHGPKFPYTTTTYVGYNRAEMERKYRADNNLRHKKIEWVILGE